MPKKIDWKKAIKNNLLIIFGSILLAFATGIFLTKLEIVSGGVTGIAIIIQHFINYEAMDILIAAMNLVCWILGFLFVSKQFAFKTILASITYPLFLALFIRIPGIYQLADLVAGNGEVGNIILCSIFGGFFTGMGLALTFLGGGSTGGVDVFIFMISKNFKIRESIVSFCLDAIVIISAMIAMPNKMVACMCGVITAAITALLIRIVYVDMDQSYQADIISDKWEEISSYAQDVLGRGATIISAEGGYKNEKRVILRVVFDKKQYTNLKNFIHSVDPKAFVTFTQTNAVYGEGFRAYISRKKKK